MEEKEKKGVGVEPKIFAGIVGSIPAGPATF